MDIPITMTPTIAALAAALAKAQGDMRGAVKDSLNPHFKSRYADLASVWDAIRGPLSSHGLSIAQFPVGGAEGSIGLTTILLHESGEWMQATASMVPTQNTPQGIGSCLTYLRRYTLAAVTGVAPEDDDGQEASRPSSQAAPKPPAAPAGFEAFLLDFEAVAANGYAALTAAWNAAPDVFREFAKTRQAEIHAIKAKARAVDQGAK